MRYLILHGLEGSGPDHWQTWLADRLRAAGHDVRYPDLPDADAPAPDRWLAALEREREPEQVVLCHSLACVLWLHHRAAGGPPAQRALLVAPPCPQADVAEIQPFFPVPREPGVTPEARIACSGADPYCPVGAPAYYADVGVPIDLLPGAGHVNTDAGFGPWPAVEAWCYGAKNGIET